MKLASFWSAAGLFEVVGKDCGFPQDFALDLWIVRCCEITKRDFRSVQQAGFLVRLRACEHPASPGGTGGAI